MGTVPVYVISLRDSEVRRRNMTERLGALGIPFRFVDAIDGRTQRLPDVFDGARVDRSGFWGESALACAMSQRKVHRMIAEGESDLAPRISPRSSTLPNRLISTCSSWRAGGSDGASRLARSTKGIRW